VVALHERLVKTRQKLIEASAPTHDLMKAGEILQIHTQTVGNVLQSVSAGTGQKMEKQKKKKKKIEIEKNFFFKKKNNKKLS